MSKKRQYTKESIENALKFIENNEGSIRQAAKKFNLPRSSIQFKIRNPDTKFKSGPDPVLTVDEENELCNFIIEMSKRGFPRKKEDIKICVQDFLRENPRPNPFRDGKPGEVWFKAFLKRNPNISIRTSEGVTNASACVSEQDIRKWFQEIRQYIEGEGLCDVIQDPTRVFNADETGFNICPKTGKVLAEKGCKNVYEIEKASAKENITVLFTFSAAGQVCKPMIIYPYKRIPDRVSLSVPSGWGIGRSDSGWMTAEVFYDYIDNCFYQQLLDSNIPLPVILFVDGHKTHLTIQVSELCRSKKIHLIALYPNATRILQPADVAAFRPIKVGWKKALRDWYAANNYQTSLTKETFAPLLKTVVDSSTKKDTLINGFRVSGLYPFEPNNVDYSKCIPSAKQPADEPASDMNAEGSGFALSYSDFRHIVGESILTKCHTATALTLLDSDENFNVIHKIWQKFKGLSENYNNDTLDLFNEMYMEDSQPIIQGVTDLPFIEDNEGPGKILDECSGELIEINKRREKDMKEVTETKKNEEYSKLQISTNSRDTNSPQPSTSKQMDLLILKNSTETNSPQPSTSKQMDLQIPKTIILQTNSHLPNTSKPIDPNKKITVISNVPISEFLKKNLPGSPKRQGKRQIDRLPFALTSDHYVEKIKAKQLQKQVEEAAKEERKRLRENKKLQKENSVPKKKPKKSNNKTEKNKTKILESQEKSQKQAENKRNRQYHIVCCDFCLSPITRRVIACSQCRKRFHVSCIPSAHQIHIPDDDDDAFLCHICYKESNSDSSDYNMDDV